MTTCLQLIVFCWLSMCYYCLFYIKKYHLHLTAPLFCYFFILFFVAIKFFFKIFLSKKITGAIMNKFGKNILPNDDFNKNICLHSQPLPGNLNKKWGPLTSSITPIAIARAAKPLSFFSYLHLFSNSGCNKLKIKKVIGSFFKNPLMPLYFFIKKNIFFVSSFRLLKIHERCFFQLKSEIKLCNRNFTLKTHDF